MPFENIFYFSDFQIFLFLKKIMGEGRWFYIFIAFFFPGFITRYHEVICFSHSVNVWEGFTQAVGLSHSP